jgi:hypothetical protein
MSKQQIAIDWLFQQLWETPKDKLTWYSILKEAKAMKKEQIINTFKEAQVLVVLDDTKRAEQYYNETYESKGSDDHIGDVNEMVEISDEEIIKLANEYILYNYSKRQWVIEGMKLYREQLKKK